MKKINTVLLCSLLLCACSESEYVHSSEPRSQVYYGQPVADVYENFGAPTQGIRLSNNERILVWISQEIEKDWAYRYLHACTVKIHLRNERVINWFADGQGCVISSNSDSEEIDELIESKKSNNIPTYSLPTDAFNGNASSIYATSQTGATLSNSINVQQPFFGNISSSTARVTSSTSLPDDAFESGWFSSGNTSETPNTYTPAISQSLNPSLAPQQPSAPHVIPKKSDESSWFSTDESDDEWGLFDS